MTTKKHNYYCDRYQKDNNGIETCEEKNDSLWNMFIKWVLSKNGLLVCKGNKHNCNKLKERWLESLVEEEVVK
jgi:hypothetical protein